MLTIEKKLYAFIDKYLHFIVVLFVSAVVLFMNRQTLYCVRPYEGADMWEASDLFVHSPVYILFVRKTWIELLNGNYALYHELFWPFSYIVAFLGAAVYHLHKKKMNVSHSLVNTSIFFCIILITPMALLYGPIMAHMDGISMSFLLLGFLLERLLPSAWKWIPFTIGLSLAVSLHSSYVFFAVVLMIYGMVMKEKCYVFGSLVSVTAAIFLNLLTGFFMDFSVEESMFMFFRFFYISQATGTGFVSIFSWFLYMIFWNGYWIGMLLLFLAFVKPRKAPLYVLFHIILFFYGITVFLNGYF